MVEGQETKLDTYANYTITAVIPCIFHESLSRSVFGGRKKKLQLVSLAVFTGGQDEFLYFRKPIKTHQN